MIQGEANDILYSTMTQSDITLPCGMLPDGYRFQTIGGSQEHTMCMRARLRSLFETHGRLYVGGDRFWQSHLCSGISVLVHDTTTDVAGTHARLFRLSNGDCVAYIELIHSMAKGIELADAEMKTSQFLLHALINAIRSATSTSTVHLLGQSVGYAYQNTNATQTVRCVCTNGTSDTTAGRFFWGKFLERSELASFLWLQLATHFDVDPERDCVYMHGAFHG